MTTYLPVIGANWLQIVNDNFALLAGAELIELASSAETITGTDTAKGVTPAGLAALTSTNARKGLIEIATDAEAIAGSDTSRAVTPANLLAVHMKMDVITFVGRNGAGACTATGLAVGDVILSVTGQVAADVGDKSSLFESTVTVINQIQQSSATDLSTKVYMAFILRKS